MKTKPTQQSIKDLRSLGVVPDFLVLITPGYLDKGILDKLSINCSINKNNIICNIDVPNIYYVPTIFQKQNFGDKILDVLKIKPPQDYNFKEYSKIISYYELEKNPKRLLGSLANMLVHKTHTCH